MIRVSHLRMEQVFRASELSLAPLLGQMILLLSILYCCRENWHNKFSLRKKDNLNLQHLGTLVEVGPYISLLERPVSLQPGQLLPWGFNLYFGKAVLF